MKCYDFDWQIDELMIGCRSTQWGDRTVHSQSCCNSEEYREVVIKLAKKTNIFINKERMKHIGFP